jgi:hypothetical protein
MRLVFVILLTLLMIPMVVLATRALRIVLGVAFVVFFSGL